MARHRDSGAEREPDEAVSLDPLNRYKPLGKPGPTTTLTEQLTFQLCRHVAAGLTLRDAAALVGTTDTVVQGWRARGTEAIERGETNLYTAFVMEYEAAGAHFRRTLHEAQLENIGNRNFNDKWLRWRLGLSDPKNFTLPRTTGAAGGDGSAPELVSPEEAQKALAERMARFLSSEDKRKVLLTPMVEE
ncbi:hypothetical protein HPP05_24605 [Corallococcus exiguus]|uniref:Uncharacterized protein n=1 Tax=Corallococcus carmarthensis TaxID=2316728 RepID=A0A3A8K9X2_9BACT|nr:MULTISPECIES: hypothetical protein [Corallococcus]NPC72931.1 hypothetical protein [Corallococcus exiguus]RKG99211.1 hypothetical protein D7X32_27170 [Corallococcus carmarthensis]